MNLLRLLALAGPMFAWSTMSALSQTPLITSFGANGVLVCTNLAPGTFATVEWSSLANQWQDLQSVPVQSDGSIQVSLSMAYTAPTFFRVRGTNATSLPPANMALIPAGSFTMGDTLDGDTHALPLHSVYISEFYMDKYEVTKALWDEVYNWATNHGYVFLYSNSGQGKAANHPAHSMTWFDAARWCNARSEKEGRTMAYYTDAGLSNPYRTGQAADYVKWNAGYRLPTEAEWEKAARGGVSGRRFPWSDTDYITYGKANYYVIQSATTNYFPYDLGATNGFHPTFDDGDYPCTSPVGYFAPNGYGLYDMAGNVMEWCWDWHSYEPYSSSPQSDPRGPAPSFFRVIRGGAWNAFASNCRAADRNHNYPTDGNNSTGFRTVLPAGQ